MRLIHYYEIKPFFTSKEEDVMTDIACENQVDNLPLVF